MMSGKMREKGSSVLFVAAISGRGDQGLEKGVG